MTDRAAPHLFVIFGATGDLAHRKLLPALCRLARRGLLGVRYAVLGAARDAKMNDDGYRAWARGALAEAGVPADEIAALCERRLYYQPIGEGRPVDYRALADRIDPLDREHRLGGNRAFYLALPAAAFPPTIAGLGEAGLNRAAGWTRLVIEKPFGRDLASARELNRLVHLHFDESQIYRIDHYLGKETVQNLLVFRFSNAIFESLWNRDRVESIEITVAEDLGVGSRARTYEQAGALRDMVQNHLTQLLTLIAMEVPAAFEADAIRYEKAKVLRAVQPIGRDEVVFGRYARGTVDGREVPGFAEEPGVTADAKAETFVALRLSLDTWRWQGVPFFLRTGKRLARRVTQIAVNFRRAPVCLFESLGSCLVHANVLVMTLQPDEGFSLYFDVKRPGDPLALETLPLHFHYQEAFGAIPEAYETLLLDVLTGDQTLFVHADEVESSWRIYAPLLTMPIERHAYAAGSWGPRAAERLFPRPPR